MTDREAMKQALEALKFYYDQHGEESDAKVITALRERLAQPEQEPVAWIDAFGNVFPLGAQRGPKHLNEPMKPLYTVLPQRKPLPPQSPCEMTQAEGKMFKLGWLECEAAHGIKGEA